MKSFLQTLINDYDTIRKWLKVKVSRISTFISSISTQGSIETVHHLDTKIDYCLKIYSFPFRFPTEMKWSFEAHISLLLSDFYMVTEFGHHSNQDVL